MKDSATDGVRGDCCEVVAEEADEYSPCCPERSLVQRRCRCGKSHGLPVVGSVVPEVIAQAVSPDGHVVRFSLREEMTSKKGFALLFFFPLAFTFVCPTELVSLNDHVMAFFERSTRIFAISVDSVHSLMAWRRTEYDAGGIGEIHYSLVSDVTRAISEAFGVLNCIDGVSMRAAFVIDKHMRVRYLEMVDMQVARDVGNLLSKIDAIAHYEKYGELCPAGWKRGDTGLKPDLEGVGDYLMSRKCP